MDQACAEPGLIATVRWHVIEDLLDRGSMTIIHKLSGTVDVDGVQYEWELRSEPRWSEFEGWKGMTVSLTRKHTQRGALLEFPAPKRLMKGLPRGRLQISDAVVIRGIQAALSAGWEPASRGADSDDPGRPFRSDPGHCSDMMPAG